MGTTSQMGKALLPSPEGCWGPPMCSHLCAGLQRALNHLQLLSAGCKLPLQCLQHLCLLLRLQQGERLAELVPHGEPLLIPGVSPPSLLTFLCACSLTRWKESSSSFFSRSTSPWACLATVICLVTSAFW